MRKRYPGIPTQYTADKGRVIKCKTKLEAKICKYLDIMVRAGEYEGWKYEPKMFEFPNKHGITRYKPDFRVTVDNGHFWIEAKGYFDAASATKARRFAKYYPSEKIELWMQNIPAGRTKKSRARLAKIDKIRYCFSRVVDASKMWKG